MAGQPGQEAEAATVPVRGDALDSTLLIDRFLPRYDFVVAHAGVFRTPPEECYRTARDLDLLGDPVIRTLLGLRSLPQRLADSLGARRDAAAEAPPRAHVPAG